ncbi:uncharacterized protein AKAW2_51031A [Aspergillus luchuensis]|uniref:F-box domain-containing protein n=2 Tax=Aspergillus kawachii TaxID=1069201 RepID=A0A146FYB6_ASPKA|nr:uncharacterized protein AKAW2_51031A [Aspergillus luchuensis]OJZ82991.1 hypothetical protein ASPFODRAFT_50883 [Aspergillus luchuensis CBS 106.47]GAA90842.1 hypothetical protein AKAW_08956 [Aspergillus luchuensis IFO 4308]BCS00690.1 hypothetical protein AKAW2_51031A [Aspergillus luchuensis]BCS12456.1 hypothetical protein ALUC_50502A [Aspergillus luchuensis]GAT29962.1 hypothetical protein RIB2604_03103000 [Aspergillus luchuensis]
MSLLNLPQEILVLIISKLQASGDYNTLLKLCQTSKTVCALVQPKIFRQYPRWGYIDDRYWLPVFEHRIGSLICFIRTVIERPGLGACVRSLTVEAFNQRSYLPQDWEKKLLKDLFEMFARAANQLPASWKQQYLTAPDEVHSNSLLMLLITLTPKLETLRLKITEEGLEGLEGLEPLWERDSQSVRSHGYLANLKELDIECDEMLHKSMRGLFHLMHLPNLNELTLYDADEDGPGCPPLELLLPKSLSITTLKLVGVKFHQTTLRQMVHACRSLKVFCYYSAWETEDASHPKKSDLVSILKPHQNSLQQIDADLDAVRPRDFSEYGSFTAFTSLTHLGLAQTGLKDAADLPGSLEHLRLVVCAQPVYEFLTSLISKRKIGQLALKSLKLYQNGDIHPREGSWILGIKPFPELWETEEGRVEMMKACRRLDDLIETADFSVEIFSCSAWKMYLVMQEKLRTGSRYREFRKEYEYVRV